MPWRHRAVPERPGAVPGGPDPAPAEVRGGRLRPVPGQPGFPRHAGKPGKVGSWQSRPGSQEERDLRGVGSSAGQGGLWRRLTERERRWPGCARRWLGHVRLGTASLLPVPTPWRRWPGWWRHRSGRQRWSGTVPRQPLAMRRRRLASRQRCAGRRPRRHRQRVVPVRVGPSGPGHPSIRLRLGQPGLR